MHRSASVLVILGASAAASGQSLFISQPNTNYDARYGTDRWDDTSAYIDGAFDSVTVGEEIDDLDALLSHDRLWLDQRFDEALSPDEVENLLAFAATGRRVVIIGENDNWPNWNASILGAFGGSVAGAADGLAGVIADHEITDGVATIDIVAGSAADGGEALFDQNVASLWGGNVLIVLDSNLWDDDNLDLADNRRFTENAIDWLAVPAPAGAAVLGVACLALRRRR